MPRGARGAYAASTTGSRSSPSAERPGFATRRSRFAKPKRSKLSSPDGDKPHPGCARRERTPWVVQPKRSELSSPDGDKPHPDKPHPGCARRERTPWVRSGKARVGRLGANRDFQNAVALMPEQVIRLFDLIERKRVRHQCLERRAFGGYDAHQPSHALLATRTEGRDQRVVAEARCERVERQRQMSGIDAEARKSAAWANRSQRVLEGGLRSESLDRDVGAAAGELLDLGHDVLLFVIQHHVRAHS